MRCRYCKGVAGVRYRRYPCRYGLDRFRPAGYSGYRRPARESPEARRARNRCFPGSRLGTRRRRRLCRRVLHGRGIHVRRYRFLPSESATGTAAPGAGSHGQVEGDGRPPKLAGRRPVCRSSRFAGKRSAHGVAPDRHTEGDDIDHPRGAGSRGAGAFGVLSSKRQRVARCGEEAARGLSRGADDGRLGRGRPVGGLIVFRRRRTDDRPEGRGGT